MTRVMWARHLQVCCATSRTITSLCGLGEHPGRSKALKISHVFPRVLIELARRSTPPCEGRHSRNCSGMRSYIAADLHDIQAYGE